MHLWKLSCLALVCLVGCGVNMAAPRPLAQTAKLELYLGFVMPLTHADFHS